MTTARSIQDRDQGRDVAVAGEHSQEEAGPGRCPRNDRMPAVPDYGKPRARRLVPSQPERRRSDSRGAGVVIRSATVSGRQLVGRRFLEASQESRTGNQDRRPVPVASRRTWPSSTANSAELRFPARRRHAQRKELAGELTTGTQTDCVVSRMGGRLDANRHAERHAGRRSRRKSPRRAGEFPIRRKPTRRGGPVPIRRPRTTVELGVRGSTSRTALRDRAASPSGGRAADAPIRSTRTGTNRHAPA